MSDDDPPLPQFIGKEEFDALPDGKAADAASKAFKRRVEGQDGFHQAVDQFEKARTDDAKNHAVEIAPLASGPVPALAASPRATQPQAQKPAIPKDLIPRNLVPTVPRMNVAIAQDKRATRPPVVVKTAVAPAPARKPGATGVALALALVAVALVIAVIIVLPDGGEKPAPSGVPAAVSGPVVGKTTAAPPVKTVEPTTPVPTDTAPLAPTSAAPSTTTPPPDKSARPPVATTEPTAAPGPSSSGIWLLKKPKK